MDIIQRMIAIANNHEGQRDLAQTILTVLDSDEGAVSRLIAIRVLCYKAIENYKLYDEVTEDEEDEEVAEEVAEDEEVE